MVIEKITVSESEKDVQITSPDTIVPLLREFYENTEKEVFTVISLNGNHKVISIRAISVGTVNKSLVHPREVFRYAIQENASAIIVSHNHPSGDCGPSEDDIKTTKALIQASEIIGIPILDHIIIGDYYYSFLEHDLVIKE